jgi:dUTP pyrophosphatase
MDPTLTQLILDTYDRYMLLNIYTENIELRDYYVAAANNHNNYLFNESKTEVASHIDSGFDIMATNDFIQTKHMGTRVLKKVDFNISCSAKMVKQNKTYNTGYYMDPRSSLSKTSLRLANSIGIIDSGYRGHLIGMFDEHEPFATTSKVDEQHRFVQICSPDLSPIVVNIVETKEELGEPTSRGDGGFGSTGTTGLKK